jgi:putative salt-induced outer membrane protein YdiY
MRYGARILLGVSSLLPILSADQVILKNGDTITGSIVKKDGDKLTVKSEFLGEVTMPWTSVTAIKSDNPLFVGLPKGQVSGKLSTAGNSVEVETPAGRQNAPLAEISTIRDQSEQHKYERLQAPGWLDLWAGYFDLGFAVSRGNARTDTLTTAFTASRPTQTDKTTVYFNQIYSTATLNGKSGATAQAVRGGASYDHNVSPRVFVNVFNDYEYDAFQSLDLRFVLGGGFGYHLINRERTKLDVLGGADYDRETFSNNLKRSSAEAYWGDTLSHKVSGMTSLTQSFRMFDNLSQSGQYRFNFDLGTATTLKKWLIWQITASDRYLSNPDFGRQRNDILLTTGLRVNFAR